MHPRYFRCLAINRLTNTHDCDGCLLLNAVPNRNFPSNNFDRRNISWVYTIVDNGCSRLQIDKEVSHVFDSNRLSVPKNWIRGMILTRSTSFPPKSPFQPHQLSRYPALKKFEQTVPVPKAYAAIGAFGIFTLVSVFRDKLRYALVHIRLQHTARTARPRYMGSLGFVSFHEKAGSHRVELPFCHRPLVSAGSS